MKISGKFLLFSAFPLLGASAFMTQPQSAATTALKAFDTPMGYNSNDNPGREPLDRESVSTEANQMDRRNGLPSRSSVGSYERRGDRRGMSRRGSYNNYQGNSRYNNYRSSRVNSRFGYGGRVPLNRESVSAQRRAQGGYMSDKLDVTIQGGSLRTWAFNTAERVQIQLNTEGRPLDADIELWHGPDNTPQKMKVYIEDGYARPFTAMLETPRGPNTVAIRNIGYLEFPMEAGVQGGTASEFQLSFSAEPIVIQGGALRTFSYEPVVDSVQILLQTDGRPLNARIELLQGPNNNKQVIELYTEDGIDRPFYAILPTPGSGNVVRVVNTSPMEFPLTASVEPFEIGQIQYGVEDGIMIGGM